MENEAEHEPDARRTMKEIIEARGFTFEEHEVVTKDGYILTMHRLFSNQTEAKNSPVAFM